MLAHSGRDLLNWLKKFSSCVAVTVLMGCGTHVPEIQEVGDDAQGELLVKAIVGSIRCEIRDAVNKVITADLNAAAPNKGIVYTKFLDKWAAQVALTLQIDEKSTLNPSAVWTPPSVRDLDLYPR
jgi:hypothetical protein